VGAIPYQDTGVVDEPWDAGKEQGAISNDAGAATLRKMYTWVDASGDPNAKASYKLPHHKVSGGTVGPANVNGVRAALSRAPQGPTQIPAKDVPAIQAHLNRHLSKFKNKSEAEQLGEEAYAVAFVMTSGKCWAIDELKLRELVALEGHSFGSDIEALSKGRQGVQNSRGVSVVPLKGVITPTPSILSLLFGGGGGLTGFMDDMRQAVADADTHSIVIDVDSPGGLVDGVPEAAAELRAMRADGGKPIVAVANYQAGSAAYWLASQANEVIASPTAEVGSIGVYQVHEDRSAMYEGRGVRHTIISAGAHKTEGNPYQPLTEAAAGHAAEAVNDLYSMFVRDVATGRSAEVTDDQIREGTAFGGGRAYLADRAKRAGLVDRVATLNETVRRFGTGRARAKQPVSANVYSRDQRLRLLDALVPSR